MCLFGPIFHIFLSKFYTKMYIFTGRYKSTFLPVLSRKFANSQIRESFYPRHSRLFQKSPHTNVILVTNARKNKMRFLLFFEFFNHLLAFSLIIIFGGRGRKKVAKYFALSSDKTFAIWPKFRNFCPLDL